MKDLNDILRKSSTLQGESKALGGEWRLWRRLEQDRVACYNRRKDGIDRDEIREATNMNRW